jgi:uncharacterized protein with FMN-binding domain
MRESGSNKKVANSLVALSSAAVLAVYAAGYTRTRSAADRFDQQAAGRRPAHTGLQPNAPPNAESRPAAPGAPSAPAPPTPARDGADTSAKPAPSAAPDPGGAAAAAATAAPSTTAAPLAVPVAQQAASPAVPPAAPPAAAAPVPEPSAQAAPPPPAPPALKDGTYYGWGSSRHGDIQAAVVIESGRIASATIAQCLTRYSCSVIDKLPPEVAQRQSPEVDYVSGATQSTNAFYYAVVDALGKAK